MSSGEGFERLRRKLIAQGVPNPEEIMVKFGYLSSARGAGCPGRHRLNPLERDMEGSWDGVVMRESGGKWIRYTDRAGLSSERIIP